MHSSALNGIILVVGLFMSAFFVWLGTIVPAWGPVIALSGLLAALVTLVRPRAGLYILVFSMLLSPAFEFGALGSSSGAHAARRVIEIRLDDIFLVLVFISWFTVATLRKEALLGLEVPMIRSMMAYLAAALIASILGVMAGELRPIVTFVYWLKYAQYFMLYYMSFHLIENFEKSKPFLWAGLATAGAVLLWAYFVISQGDRPYCPFDNIGGQAETATLAGYLVMISGVAGGLALYHDNLAFRLLMGGVILACITPVLVASSRSSYLAGCVMLVAMIFLGKGRRLTLVSVTLVAALYIVPVFYKDYLKLAKARVTYTFAGKGQLQSTKVNLAGTEMELEGSVSARVRNWRYMRDMWLQERPFLGYGVTGVGLVDSQIPRVVGETGLIGFACWVAVMGGLFVRIWRLRSLVEDPFQHGLIFGFLCMYIGLIVQSVGVNTFLVIRLMEPFWFLAAVLMRLYVERQALPLEVDVSPARLSRFPKAPGPKAPGLTA